MATKPMTNSQKVEYVMQRLDVDAYWLWKRAFDFSEIREENWYVTVKVREYYNFDIVPDYVIELVDRMIEDSHCLFFKDKDW